MSRPETMRRAAPLVFAALCLGLSGLVLRRQIAAHPPPAPPPAPTPRPSPPPAHVAGGAARRAVLDTVLGQLAALRAGDADKALSYQSRGLRRNFGSAAQFTRMIVTHYPEFGRSRAADCGPVLTDPTGRYATVVVTVTGEDGRRARGYYQLLREDGVYRVAGVVGGQPLP